MLRLLLRCWALLAKAHLQVWQASLHCFLAAKLLLSGICQMDRDSQSTIMAAASPRSGPPHKLGHATSLLPFLFIGHALDPKLTAASMTL